MGKVLTREMVDEGWHVDGQGRLRSPSGRIITDENGKFQGADPFERQTDFNGARSKISDPMEKDKFTKETLREIATKNGWVRDGKMSKKTGRDVYRTDKGDYRVADRTHGQFEYHDKKGRHEGQFDIEGNKTKNRNSKYDF